jgi:transcriptional regulator with XRE-family HTH domain
MNHASEAHGIAQWREAIEDNPDVTWRILSDIVKVVQAEQVPHRTGRRPAPEMMGFDQLLDTIYPERFSEEPFPVALESLMSAMGATQMMFAPLMHVSQPQLSRLLTGKVKPDLRVMENAASACGVTAAYFVEWRAWKIAELIADVYLRQPRLSIIAVKQVARSIHVSDR